MTRRTAWTPIFDAGVSRRTIPASQAPTSPNPLPVGGSAGQVLAKIDGTDYNVEWVDQSGGGGGGAALEAQFGFGGLVAPSAQVSSPTYEMAGAVTFTEVICSLSASSAAAYTIRVFVNGVQQDFFTFPASQVKHTEVVSIAVVAGNDVSVKVDAAPLATGENLLVVCR